MARTFLDRHFGLIAVILFCVVALFSGILLQQVINTSNLFRQAQTGTTPVPTEWQGQVPGTPAVTQTQPLVTSAPKQYATDLGQRIPGSTEDIPIIAAPRNADDAIAMVRWYVENGEVLSLKITGYVNLGACPDQQKFTSTNVCVDIAKNGPFNQGELLGTVTVKWAATGNGMIYRLDSDGYYNGKNTSYTYQKNNKLTIEAGAFGKVAGETVPSSTITFPTLSLILISLGTILVFVAGIGLYLNIQINKKNNTPEAITSVKRSNQTFQIMVISGLFVLGGGVLFAANWMAANNTSPTQSQALTTSPTPIYVTLLVTPTPVPSITPTGELMITIIYTTDTPTPVPTATPTLVVTATPAATPTPLPLPTRLPVTDNTPVLCGPLDVDGNHILNYIDYNSMMTVYGLTCSDSPYAHTGCGGKDTNDDGKIDYIDLYYLVNHYYPNVVDCTRSW
jgi:hypothetical protein